MIRKTAVALMLIASLFTVAAVQASPYDDYNFSQDRMIIDGSDVFVLSTFDSSDHITKMNKFGDKIWEAKFGSKIISWRVTKYDVYVFSKDRKGNQTYLTKLDRYSGAPIWER